MGEEEVVVEVGQLQPGPQPSQMSELAVKKLKKIVIMQRFPIVGPWTPWGSAIQFLGVRGPIPFATTYLCVAGFSSLLYLKNNTEIS